MLGSHENQSFFHNTLRSYQFMYTVRDLLKVLTYGWKCGLEGSS